MANELGTGLRPLTEALANMHVAVCHLDGRLSMVKDVGAAWGHLLEVLRSLRDKGSIDSTTYETGTYKFIGNFFGPAELAEVRRLIREGKLKRSRPTGR